MGLDTTHDCWHGAYGAFARWRDEIARAAGVPFAVDPEHGDREHYTLPWHWLKPENYQGDWDHVPGDDPLIVLLGHSDCDGVIHPQHGALIADRLEELLPKLDERHAGGHIWNMREVTERFIAGLREAASLGEDVEFH